MRHSGLASATIRRNDGGETAAASRPLPATDAPQSSVDVTLVFALPELSDFMAFTFLDRFWPRLIQPQVVSVFRLG
jgi:hypothetical protein